MVQWGIKEVLVSNLKPFPGNPRDIQEANFVGLFESIKRFGLVEPIVWNKKTGHVLGGNQRLKIVKESGVEKIYVVVVDVVLEDELAINLSLNNPGIEGDWSDNASEFIRDLDDSTPELYEALRFDALVAHLESNGQDDLPSSGGRDGEDDTECPCCGHSWKLKPGDVAVVGEENDG